MSIQEDAGEVLIYAYNEYTNKGEGVNEARILEETKWDRERLRRAVTYLNDSNLVRMNFFLGGNFFIQRPYPLGIAMVENEKEFQRNFNLEVGVPGLFKFSWGATER